jgi:hypothetical protein
MRECAILVHGNGYMATRDVAWRPKNEYNTEPDKSKDWMRRCAKKAGVYGKCCLEEVAAARRTLHIARSIRATRNQCMCGIDEMAH